MAAIENGARQGMLHRLLVALVVLQLLSSGGVAAAFMAGLSGEGFHLTLGVTVHFALGTLIVLLVGLQLARRTPAPEQRSALCRRIVTAFYGVLMLQPVTGVMAWAVGSVEAAGLHAAVQYAVMGLLAAHLLCAGLDTAMHRAPRGAR